MVGADVETLKRGYAALNRASGLPVETRLAHVWTVANGRAVRWEAVPDVEAALGPSP
jgi:hypothetical protein